MQSPLSMPASRCSCGCTLSPGSADQSGPARENVTRELLVYSKVTNRAVQERPLSELKCNCQECSRDTLMPFCGQNSELLHFSKSCSESSTVWSSSFS